MGEGFSCFIYVRGGDIVWIYFVETVGISGIIAGT